MLLATSDQIDGMRITKTLGLVQGNTVVWGPDFKGISQSLTRLKRREGGELFNFTNLLTDARKEAVGRMEAQAKQLGANAVVGLCYVTTSLINGTFELLAYGTAVLVEDSDTGVVPAP